MNRRTWRIGSGLLLATSFCAVGCEEPKDVASSSTSVSAPPSGLGTAPADVETPTVVAPVVPPVVPPVIPPPLPPNTGGSSENSASPPADAGDRTVAKVGVGAKGRYDSNDYVSTVVGAYFGIQQRLAFDQAQRGLNDFKTLNGDYPKTHEQYWKEVIEANLISLPELPEGEEYYYDYEAAKSTRGEESLFVVKPKP